MKQKIFELLPIVDLTRVSTTCKELRQFIREELHIKALDNTGMDNQNFLSLLKKHARWLRELTINFDREGEEEDTIRRVVGILNKHGTRLTSLRAGDTDVEQLMELDNIQQLKTLEINAQETSPNTTAFFQRLTSIETLIHQGLHIDLNSLPTGKLKSLSLSAHTTDNFSEFFINNPQCITLNIRDLDRHVERKQIQRALTNVKNLNISIWNKHDLRDAVTAATTRLNSLTIECHTIQLLNKIFRKIKHRNIRNVTLTTLDNTHVKWQKSDPNYHRKIRSAEKVIKRTGRYPNFKVEKITMPDRNNPLNHIFLYRSEPQIITTTPNTLNHQITIKKETINCSFFH